MVAVHSTLLCATSVSSASSALNKSARILANPFGVPGKAYDDRFAVVEKLRIRRRATGCNVVAGYAGGGFGEWG